MEEKEINALREAVAAARQSGATVFWQDSHGAMLQVMGVPTRPLDPDKTGTKDFIAWIGQGRGTTGHIDLSNAEPADFLVATRLFQPVPGE